MKKKNSFKWLVCLICLMGMAVQMNVMAGGVKKVSSMKVMSQAGFPYHLTRNIDSDFRFDPLLYINDTSMYCMIVLPNAKKSNSLHFISNGGEFASNNIVSVSTEMKKNREIFYQRYDTNTVFSYFVDYDADAKVINVGRMTSGIVWILVNHEDSVYTQLTYDDSKKYSYSVVHAVSPNQRYLAYEFLTLEHHDYGTEIVNVERLRWDMQTDVIDKLESPVGYINKINNFRPELAVTNQGEVLEMVFNTTNLKGLKEAFAKESIDFFDYSASQEYYYLQVNHFPLHSRGNVVNYILKNKNFDHPKLKIMEDNRLLIYGFSQTIDSVFWNTIEYDLMSQNFENHQQSYVMDRWTQEMRYRNTVSANYNIYSIITLGLEQLNDGSFVAFADWRSQALQKNNSFEGFIDFHCNLLHCVLDSNLKIKAHGMQYNEYISVEDKAYNLNRAQAYTGTQGDKAVLFVPISQKNSKNKLCSKKQSVQKHYYTADTYMKVLTVDSENHETTSIVKNRTKYDLMMGQPKYDPVAKEWLLTLMSNKNMRLEHWKIK